MGLLDSLLGSVLGGGQQPAGDANPIVGLLTGLLNQNGGLQGLLGQFASKGLGDAAQSWVGMGENQPVSGEQIQSVLGNEQIAAIAAKLGIDPSMASGAIASVLPKVVDKLTPTGQVDPDADHAGGIAAMLPGLLQSGLGSLLGGGK